MPKMHALNLYRTTNHVHARAYLQCTTNHAINARTQSTVHDQPCQKCTLSISIAQPTTSMHALICSARPTMPKMHTLNPQCTTNHAKNARSQSLSHNQPRPCTRISAMHNQPCQKCTHSIRSARPTMPKMHALNLYRTTNHVHARAYLQCITNHARNARTQSAVHDQPCQKCTHSISIAQPTTSMHALNIYRTTNHVHAHAYLQCTTNHAKNARTQSAVHDQPCPKCTLSISIAQPTTSMHALICSARPTMPKMHALNPQCTTNHAKNARSQSLSHNQPRPCTRLSAVHNQPYAHAQCTPGYIKGCDVGSPPVGCQYLLGNLCACERANAQCEHVNAQCEDVNAPCERRVSPCWLPIFAW